MMMMSPSVLRGTFEMTFLAGADGGISQTK